MKNLSISFLCIIICGCRNTYTIEESNHIKPESTFDKYFIYKPSSMGPVIERIDSGILFWYVQKSISDTSITCIYTRDSNFVSDDNVRVGSDLSKEILAGKYTFSKKNYYCTYVAMSKDWLAILNSLPIVNNSDSIVDGFIKYMPN